VISAVNGQIEVYMDGGVRLGTDVLKALALGARAVFIGRPVIWGLAYQVTIALTYPRCFSILDHPCNHSATH